MPTKKQIQQLIKKQRKKRDRLKKPNPPPSFLREERKYQREIERKTASYLRAAEQTLSKVDTLGALNKATKDLTKYINKQVPSYTKMANTHIRALDKGHKKYFDGMIKRSIGVDLKEQLKKENLTKVFNSRVEKNIKLIKSIPEKHLEATSKKIKRLVKADLPREKFVKQLEKTLEGSVRNPKYRARLIARDQTKKAVSDFNQARQENIGVTRYEWQTSEDDRVRPSHEEKNGEIFEWDNPPKDTGHPGEDINCRCEALPVLEDLLEGL